MQNSRVSTIGGWVTQFKSHLSVPLFRNAYLLMLNTLSTGVLGILYWILAARFYPPEVVGVNALAINTMMAISSFTGLNLSVALLRFLPRGGKKSARFILLSYATSVPLTILACLVLMFLNTAGIVRITFLNVSTAFNIWFIITATLWPIFTLQDAGLTGLRAAKWIPIENGLFGITKLVLVIGLSGIIIGTGIYLSWTLPILFAIIPINYLIFRRLIPKHVQEVGSQEVPARWSSVLRYAIGDMVGYTFWVILTSALPYIITFIGGAKSNGYFYVAWTIATAFQYISNGMALSFTVEGSLDQSEIHKLARKAYMQLLRLLLPALVLIIIAAPIALKLYGESYVRESTITLQLLCLAVLPYSVTSLYISISRVQRQLKHIAVMQAILCAITLILAYAFMQTYGISGVALAYFSGLSIVAIVLLLTRLRPVFFNRSQTAVQPAVG